MDILVTELDGKEIKLKVDPKDTIEKLKRDIEEEYKIPSEQQRFYRRGKLVSFDIDSSDTIEMLVDKIENNMGVKKGILNVYPIRQTSAASHSPPSFFLRGAAKMLVLVPVKVAKVGSFVEGKINEEIKKGGVQPVNSQISEGGHSDL